MEDGRKDTDRIDTSLIVEMLQVLQDDLPDRMENQSANAECVDSIGVQNQPEKRTHR
jgi:hypothetical protein